MSQSRLLAKLLENEITDAECKQLNRLLGDDPALRRLYRKYMTLDAMLRWEIAPPLMKVSKEERTAVDSPSPAFLPDTDAPIPDSASRPIPSSYKLPLAHSTLGGWAFSYAVATVFVCLLILGFWAYKLPSDRGSLITTNENSRGLTTPGESSPARPALVFVGRVTGIAGAKWSDAPDYLPPIGVNVRLGRKYKLKSGLLEITYDSGAKVILEGPCDYTAESTAGGYLSHGKLVAKVKKNHELRMMNDESKTRSSDIHHSSFITPHLFAVRTPTAVVTDLGTEFGVEVDGLGNTTSHVFRGSVEVQAFAGGYRNKIVLRAAQSLRVEKGKGSDEAMLVAGVVEPPKFTRRLFGPPKQLDLLDIVAGGDGRGKRRERGIDATTGMEDPLFVPMNRGGHRDYRPVSWHRFIDGVFIPDGAAGLVKLDSAGNTFDGFPETTGRTFGSIWPRATEPKPHDSASDKSHRLWVYAMGRGEQFMPEERGLLGLHSNTGITFDLAAIRRTFPKFVPGRFQAVAGVADASHLTDIADGMVDFWVFVDGRLALKRMNVRPEDAPFGVDVELKSNDRFLTLVVTDGGNTAGSDWAVFGDPVLHVEPGDANETKR